MSNRTNRGGAVLIVVTGVAAMLAALTLAFLVRMRSDAEDDGVTMREVQARIMLTAGLNYVAETARIGWGREAFGWIDVRDGRPGPRDARGVDLAGDPTRFPAIDGAAARLPMERLRRPPWAIAPRLIANPVVQDASLPWATLIDFRHPDPSPAVADPIAFAAGDRTPVISEAPAAWFRVRRVAMARFVITCGCGASQGFADWGDVPVAEQARFGSRALFDDVVAAEHRSWYEVEWTAAMQPNGFWHFDANDSTVLNELGSPTLGGNDNPNLRGFAGHFLWIRRLPAAPAAW